MRLFRTCVAAVALLASAAFAQSVLIHPFDADGTTLGTVVADRIAEGLDGRVDLLIPPVAAPSFVPPTPYADGFVNPLAVLAQGEIARLHGVQLLRSGAGVDVAVGGRLDADAEGLRLRLIVVDADGRTLERTVHAPDDDPSALVRQASAVVSGRLGLPVPEEADPIDMAGDDDALGRVLTLLAAGLVDDAEEVVARAEAAGPLPPRLEALRTTVADARAGRPGDDPATAAVLALLDGDDPEARLALWERLAELGAPAARVWTAALALDEGDLASADDRYAAAGAAYPYGAATEAAYLQAHERSGADARVAELVRGNDPAALVVAGLLADLAGDVELETAAYRRLGRVAPTFAYPYERLSFLAFRADDGLAAAQALAVAVELEPESDLYWTNLGWAWYLLGFWERSEAASERALELAPSQEIAAYNLGLVRARFGRLEAAMEAYETALRLDPAVNDEAIEDVDDALEARPTEASLHYVRARLHEERGERAEAAERYTRFLELGGAGDPFDVRAEDRFEALTAPLPPLEIAGDRIDLLLGGASLSGPWRPGDPLTLRFEAYTPGDALPGRIEATARLDAADADEGAEPRATGRVEVEVPSGAIGYVIDELLLDLPADLPAGGYRLTVRIDGDDDQAARATTELEVAGTPDPIRALVGRDVVLTSLETGRALFAPADADRPGAVVSSLIQELRDAAEAAEEALPTIESGRFAGLSGSALFETSGEGEVRDFLAFLAADGVHDARLTFVDAYAQWAVDGAP